MYEPDQIVRELQTLLGSEEPDLAELVEGSLRQARVRAREALNSELFDALEWPENLDEYYGYLQRFIRWVPQQTDAPAWKTSVSEDRHAKEVSDRLAHFFWLVDQKVESQDTAIAETSGAFREWLTQFARQWGSYLDTPASFSQDLLDSFIDSAPEYTVEESLIEGRPNAPSGWLTFNQFFARELNAGLRPITEPVDNRIVTSPADCMFRQTFDVDEKSYIPSTTIKGTHRFGNIEQLMEGSRYAGAFAGGSFVHYMLPPSAYHRYHLPVSGKVEESFVISGRVYMEVDLADGELQSRDSARSGYEFSQVRGVVTVNTTESGHGDIGIVAVIPVGMSHVASVNLTTVEGTQVAKGEEFGHFQFGGSDIIVLFQKGVDPDIDTDTGLRHVGTTIARIAPAR